MFDLLNAPYFCWHDADIRPDGDSFAESLRNFEEIINYFGTKMADAKARLLWGNPDVARGLWPPLRRHRIQ